MPFPSERGCTILLTGLPAAGKTTLARALVYQLTVAGRTVTLLDGDEMRNLMSPDLGYTREDRLTHCRRIGFIAGEVARHGGTTVCALIAPYEEARQLIRGFACAQGAFLLVHVATPIDVCARRDAKGLYEGARKGLVANLTGVADAYEVPANADLVFDMTLADPAATASAILNHLEGAGHPDASHGSARKL